jgi:protein TonB
MQRILCVRALCQNLFIIKKLVMLPEKIMQSDLLDILFENRNKTYGAYALRKSYNKTMITAISATCFIAITFFAFQFTHHEKDKMCTIPLIIPPDGELFKIDPVKPQPKVAVVKRAAKKFNQKIYSTPIITNENTIRKHQLLMI